jgi:hypothetical protein
VAHHLAQPRGDVHSRSGGHLLHLCIQVGIDQIPPDLVVKSQAADIIDIIL